MGEQNCGRVALILSNLLIFCGTVALFQLSAFPGEAAGLFNDRSGYGNSDNITYGLGVPHKDLYLLHNVLGSHRVSHPLPVFPAAFVFLVWQVIFGWLLLAHLYTLILLCRSNAVGPVYISPSVVTPGFVTAYSINLLCLVTWLFLWDNDLQIYTSAAMWAVAVSAWVAFGFIHASVHRHGPWLSAHGKADIWLTRILWHNGFALYTTWTTILALINLGIALKDEAGLDMQTIVWVVLGSLSGLMLLWFIFENTFLDRFVRYTITQYAGIVLTMTGMYLQQYASASEETQWFLVVLLGVSVFCLVARLGLVVVRACKSPLYANNKVGDDPVLSYAA